METGAGRDRGAAAGPGASFPLGSNTVAPLAMAEAFAMFANRGEHCASFTVVEVVDRDGETVSP